MNWLLFYKKSGLVQIKLLVIVFGSGCLMGLSPAPLNFWLLSWFAIVPLWILILRAQNSLKKVFLLGFSWGFGYHSLALFWLTGVHPMTWMGVPWLASLAIAIAVWLAVSFWGALLVALWAIIFNFLNRQFVETNIKKIGNKILARILFGIVIWCCLETIWSYSPLWWSSLSYTQSPHNLAILQFAKISGFNTVTAVILLINGLLAEFSIPRQKALSTKNKFLIIFIPLIAFTVLHLWGLWLYNLPFNSNNLGAIKVGIVQGNIPNEIKLFSQGWKKAIAGYTTGYRKLARQNADVILTPETALPFYWEEITKNSDFYRAVIDEKVAVWVGAYGREGNSYTNSLFTLTGEGKTFSRYDKSKLVPLGEYIPFEPIIGKIISRLSPLEAHLQAGKTEQTFDTPFGKAAIGICYESAFSQHFRRQVKAGGEFILTASNNAHYSEAMPAQHHAQDVIRAIESDRWAARATNTGYSAIVDPHGNTIWRSQINRYQIYQGNIYRRQTKTLYVKWGDWLTKVLLIISIGIAISNKTKL